MAEAVLSNIATSLLDQLSSSLKDELLLLWASEDEVQKLRKTITTVRDVLQDAEQKQANVTTVKTWLGRLQDEFYKADDLFDQISTRALQEEAMSGNEIVKEEGKSWTKIVMKVSRFISKKYNHLALLYSTAHRVKELRGNLDDICNDINRFGFVISKTEAPRPKLTRREEHSYVDKDDIIGRDEDKENLVKLLKADVHDGARVSVIAIVGIGGLGKTTLAQLVYTELQKGQKHFDLYLWACVNYFSNLNEALQKIVACGTENTYKDLTLQQLQYMLREKINSRKYLLVLDDVWDEDLDTWLRLKDLLKFGDIGSKVMVTTRSIVVAQNLSTVKPHYSLEGLSDESAWLLFKKFAFEPNQSEKIQKMETIGKDIVKKCAKVPLAIRTIGSFLRHKDERRWLNVLNNEVFEGHDKTMEVLMVSYNDLPSSLKHCFAYCSLFPKGYRFDKDELIRLWMAQGYLQSSENREQSLEDVGEDCFYSLVRRCFFQEIKEYSDNGKVSCTMHDLLHDLAVKVARKECNMVKFLSDDFMEGTRHLSYNCDVDFSENIPNSLLQMEGLRTLLFHEVRVVKAAFWDQRFLCLLRALNLSCLDMEELPSSIGKLVHLRYLDLSRNKALIELPTSICKLQNLLTLRLRDCWNLKELPIDMKLIRLRHLDIEGCNLIGMPSGLKQMTCLVTLNMFVVNYKYGGLRYLKDLNNLRGRLHISLSPCEWENSEVDAKESMLSSKTELSELEITWINSDAVLDQLQPSRNLQYLTIDQFLGKRISNWVASLENIVCLKIFHCEYCRELPPFRHLRNLKQLYLDHLPLVEYMENDICNEGKSFFPSLDELQISEMWELKGWWRQTTHLFQNSATGAIATAQLQSYSSPPSFPLLSNVTIRACPNLIEFPLFPSVESLILDRVNEKLLWQLMLKVDQQSWSKLKQLCIANIADLISLPDEWIGHFSVLSILRIEKCHMLKSLPRHLLQCLTTLEELDILECPELSLFNEENEEEDETTWSVLKRLKCLAFTIQGSHMLKGLHHLTALKKLTLSVSDSDKCANAEGVLMQWTTPPILQHLKIYKTRELSVFREVFHQLNKLVVLEFEQCNSDLGGIPWKALEGVRCLIFRNQGGMKALPEECYLPALQELVIEHCADLESLPKWVSRLRQLTILNCWILSVKYMKPAKWWPEIRDIPYVKVEQLAGLEDSCAYTKHDGTDMPSSSSAYSLSDLASILE